MNKTAQTLLLAGFFGTIGYLAGVALTLHIFGTESKEFESWRSNEPMLVDQLIQADRSGGLKLQNY